MYSFNYKSEIRFVLDAVYLDGYASLDCQAGAFESRFTSQAIKATKLAPKPAKYACVNAGADIALNKNYVTLEEKHVQFIDESLVSTYSLVCL